MADDTHIMDDDDSALAVLRSWQEHNNPVDTRVGAEPSISVRFAGYIQKPTADYDFAVVGHDFPLSFLTVSGDVTDDAVLITTTDSSRGGEATVSLQTSGLTIQVVRLTEKSDGDVQ